MKLLVLYTDTGTQKRSQFNYMNLLLFLELHGKPFCKSLLPKSFQDNRRTAMIFRFIIYL